MKYLRSLRPADTLIIAFALLLSVIVLVFLTLHSNERVSDDVIRVKHFSIQGWPWLISINLLFAIGIVALSYAASTTTSRLIRVIHDWYPAPVIFLSFKEIYVIIQSLGRPDMDATLIAIDRWIFGTDPTAWIFRFATPTLTEILQIAYASFYLLMILTGLEPYLRKERETFSFVIFTFLWGFFLSYIGYLFVPGVGPRFTLHNFSALDAELPGVFCTSAIRDFINAGESIPTGAPYALALAQRDVFPSGHTEMTLIVMYLATKLKLRTRPFLYVFGSLLILATVYLRYHYVIDLIAGAALMAFTVWSAPKLWKWWNNVVGVAPNLQGPN